MKTPRTARSRAKTVRNQVVFWHADNVGPRTPTSIDVLFRWLRIPGNYQRYQTKTKMTVCKEIVACMQKVGIRSRTPRIVAMKMSKLEKSFEAATNWLLAHGQYENFQRGETTEDVLEKINKLCPYYDQLLPIHRSKSSGVTTSRNQRTSRQHQDNESLTDSHNGPALRSKTYCVPAAQPTGSCINVPNEDEDDMKLKLEIHQQCLLDLELESRKTQLEADTICNTALNRNKMLAAGINPDEVNRILPQ